MPTYGLTRNGLRIKRLADIRDELEIAFRAAFGEEANVDPETSILGVIIGVYSEREALLWELTKSVYDAFYPTSAEGVQLDNVSDLTGISRLPATTSTVVVKCGGDPGTDIPPGRIVSVVNTGARFVSLLNLDGSTPTIGPSGFVDVLFESQVAGSIIAPAGSLTVIETPLTGWNTAINEADAVPGRKLETDAELRVRRLESLQVVGAAAVDAIRARILDDVADVTDVFVYENDSDITDGAGRPPHSIQVVAAGGADQDIGDKIWEVKSAGIAVYGTDVTVNVTDSMGFIHAISFDRAEERRTWFHITIEVGTLFNQGAKQKETITVSSNTPGETLSVTINQRTFTVTTGASDIATAALLVAAINNNANGWVPVTATDNLDGTFYLESDYPGCPFVISWENETVLGTTELSVVTDVDNTGDQGAIIDAVIAFADGTGGNPKEQTIGQDVYRSRYYSPINTVADIHTINIRTSDGLEAGDYWPTTAPPGGGDWADADVAVAADEVANMETVWITVEIV